MESYVPGEPTLLALDVPLGWPVELGTALVTHKAGDYIPMRQTGPQGAGSDRGK